MDIQHLTFKQKKLTDNLTKDSAKAEVQLPQQPEDNCLPTLQLQSEALEAFLLTVISAVQVLEKDAADMAADAPKLEARAVELTQQLQREEKVLPSSTPT